MTIDELLKKASPRPWGYTYDGSSDWSIGPKDDPQVSPKESKAVRLREKLKKERDIK